MRAKTIGDRICEKRLEYDLTLGDLGELAGLTGQTIWRYEAGWYTPRLDAAAALADALGVSLEWLVTGKKAA